MIERMKAGKVGERQKEADRGAADKIWPVIRCALEAPHSYWQIQCLWGWIGQEHLNIRFGGFWKRSGLCANRKTEHAVENSQKLYPLWRLALFRPAPCIRRTTLKTLREPKQQQQKQHQVSQKEERPHCLTLWTHIQGPSTFLWPYKWPVWSCSPSSSQALCSGNATLTVTVDYGNKEKLGVWVSQ